MTALLDELRNRPRLPSPEIAAAVRRAAGVSQQRVATELGVSRMTITRWESGARRPQGALAAAYVALLDQLREVSA